MYTLRLFFALAVACTSALQKWRTGASLSEARGETVCISLAAYEEAEYIDFLIANMLTFTESSTRLALHLNNRSEYDAERLASWNQSRVVLTNPRIPVVRFQGGVFMAHMLNAWALENRWPGECAYYVMQASNQLWVRTGLEQSVRESKFSKIHINEKASPKGRGYPFYDVMLQKGRGLQAESHPEGSFFPMETVLGCGKLLNEYLASAKETIDSVTSANNYFEATWFQTYAVNFDIPPSTDPKEFASSLCYRRGHKPTNRDGDHNDDSIDMDDMLNIVHPPSKGFAGFYSVKRVARDLKHPVTKYIAKLTLQNSESNRLLFAMKQDHVYRSVAELAEGAPDWH